MSVQITYFVHGTTTDNEQKISSGASDVALSELGVRQAHDLAALIKDKAFDVAFCSDLKRAVVTAGILFTSRVPVVEDARLRECDYGDLNGKLSALVEPLQEQMITERFPHGESYEDVKARVEDFLAFLKQRYDDKRVAIVAHKAPQLAFEVILKGQNWEEAFANDWRKTKSWQPGWEYQIL